MSEKQDSVITQLRIGSEQYEYLTAKAEGLGVSRNSLICILIDLGRRAYEGEVILRESGK